VSGIASVGVNFRITFSYYIHHKVLVSEMNLQLIINSLGILIKKVVYFSQKIFDYIGPIFDDFCISFSSLIVLSYNKDLIPLIESNG
jgi:hypothetical protein